MSNYLTELHGVLVRQSRSQHYRQETDLKEMRASTDAGVIDLLAFAEHMYKEGYQGEEKPAPSFETRKAGVQMRVIQEAFVFFRHYEKVRRFKEQGDCSHE